MMRACPTTPLCSACIDGDVWRVRALLDAGAVVDQSNDSGSSPFYFCCHGFLFSATREVYAECLQLLLNAGADVNQRGPKGITAMHMACMIELPDLARLLVEAGASVDQVMTEAGVPPLFLASQKGYDECARLLLDSGAPVDQATKDGATALVVACHEGHLGCVQLLSSYGASRSLVVDYDGFQSAEALCACWGQSEVGEWLVLSRGWTPLHHLEALTPERMRALLRAGADPHARPAEAPSQTLTVPQATPVERALAMVEPRSAVAELLLRAAERWTPHTHDLFPAAARTRAVELLWIGHQLAIQPRFAGQGQALAHAWVDQVIAHGVRRAPECPGL